MIDKAIRSRLEDGQLDECPLTMEDLQKLKVEEMVNMVCYQYYQDCIIRDLNI